MSRIEIVRFAMLMGGVMLIGSGVVSTMLDMHPLKSFGLVAGGCILFLAIVFGFVLVVTRMQK